MEELAYIPRTAQLYEAEYRAGAASAQATINSAGRDLAVRHFNVKAPYLNGWTESRILSYWTGYRDVLETGGPLI